MSGFASITNLPDYVYADNASFDGTERGGGLTTNGQLWIGNTATGQPTVNTLTAGSGVTITNGNGAITIGLTGGDVALDTVLTANATPQFVKVSDTATIDFGITNLALGSTLPALTVGTTNVAFGDDALESLTSGGGNTAIGYEAADSIDTGSNNVAIGKQSLVTSTSSVQNTAVGTFALSFLSTSVGNNTAVGYAALDSITTGRDNIGLGQGAGGNLTVSDSSNICIGNGGTSGDNNTIRLGTQGSGTGQIDTTFIAGIAGVSVATPQVVTIDPATGQMGSTVGVVSSWVEETGATRALLVNQGVLGNRGSAQTFTLPDTAAQGSIIRITQIGAGAITIAQNAGESIRFGTSTTTVGVGGSLTATNTGDSIELICVTANTGWQVLSSIGSWVVV
jgi:hypothetical protein